MSPTFRFNDPTMAHARAACRAWASVRVPLLDQMSDELREFDKAMFRLGELVNTAEGELIGVVKRDENGGTNGT